MGPLEASRSSSSPASARGRSAACCSPTWAPMSSASIAPSRPTSARSSRQIQPFDAGTPLDRARSEEAGRCRVAKEAGREGRRAGRRFSARRDGAARARPGRVPERQPTLVYGRMTGWGQEGPLAQAAGHDINYISLIGALHAIGPRERAGAAAQPGGRFRRRRALSRLRSRLRPARGAQHPARGRSSMPPWSTVRPR